MNKKTYEEIASNYELWCERADPEGTMTREEFDESKHSERVKFLVEAFGEEEIEGWDE